MNDRKQADQSFVLITRPEKDAVLYAQELEKKGFSSLVQPMLDIQSVEFQSPDLVDYQGLIFTSANAVHVFAQRSDMRALPVYVVGKQTELAARARGYTDIHCAEGAAEDLTVLIKARVTDLSKVLLHVRGVHTAYPLQESLVSGGYSVDEVIVYDSLQCEIFSEETRHAIENGCVQAVTFFSKRTAEAFMAVIDKDGLSGALSSIKALCISESVLNYVQEFNWQDAYSADTPDKNGMTLLIQQHCRKT